MHHRAIRPRARDGVERQVAQFSRLLAKRVELVRCGQFIKPALRRFKRHPVQEPRQRRAIALVRRLRPRDLDRILHRSEEHTSELKSLMRISYAVFCLKKKQTTTTLSIYRS